METGGTGAACRAVWARDGRTGARHAEAGAYPVVAAKFMCGSGVGVFSQTPFIFDRPVYPAMTDQPAAQKKHTRVSFTRAPTRVPTDIKRARLPQVVDDIADRFYTELKQTALDPRRILPADLADVVVHIMHAVEGAKESGGLGLSGPQKKTVVIKTAMRLVADVENENHRKLLEAAVTYVIPAVIDTVVAATKGQLDINPTLAAAVSKARWFCCKS